MPTQLPREATDFFGDLLLPHVPDILKSDANQGRVSLQIYQLFASFMSFHRQRITSLE